MATPEARLSFRRVGAHTVVESALAQSPLRILTPRNHGVAAWAYTSTLGGGLVDGDRIRMHVSVEPRAFALLASQGHNRVYRCASESGSELSARVAEGALLAVVPDPTVCFKGARYRQKTAIRIAPGGAAVLADVLAAGREARGERWVFDRYASELLVQCGNRVLLHETTLLDPRHGSLAGRLGRFDAIGTIVIAGERLRGARSAIARESTSAPLGRRPDIVEQANDLGEALHVRFAAASIEEAIRLIRTRLTFLPELLGDDPWARRA
ncbi:MAG TPA: urease accessory protein UreD [Myxococcales bacterium]|nr:urease accessory protein UreD [Myxococcales bacterium]